jgi:hypothetical protein
MKLAGMTIIKYCTYFELITQTDDQKNVDVERPIYICPCLLENPCSFSLVERIQVNVRTTHDQKKHQKKNVFEVWYKVL